jgi:starch phosphorylase
MVREYAEKYYFHSASKYRELSQDKFVNAKELASWKIKLNENWEKIKIENVHSDIEGDIKVGTKFSVYADVYLGDLTSEEVLVQVYHGTVDAEGLLVDATPVNMIPHKENGDKKYLFKAEITSDKSGLMGYSLRVLPNHKFLTTNFLPGLIKWA